MSLNFSAAHSSRIRKSSSGKSPLGRRLSASPLKKVQASRTKLAKPKPNDEDGDAALDDTRPLESLGKKLGNASVPDIIKYIQSHAFDDVPQAGGFNSVRIAEILNFRKALPPAVTVAHVHALASSPTRTEKEVSNLVATGTLRRVTTAGRGTGRSSISESLCLTADIERLVTQTKDLSTDLSDRFLRLLSDHPTVLQFSNSGLTAGDVSSLMRAGLVTSLSPSSGRIPSTTFSSSSAHRQSTSIASISRAASGSLAAVGGEGAVLGAGGRGGIRDADKTIAPQSLTDGGQSLHQGTIQITLPGMGPYLKLVTAARSHLMTLIEKSPSRHVPMYLLHEKWDGGISADDAAAKAKKYRGEFVGVLPARTRKWKHFSGMSFDWILTECFGAGLVEVFDTRSVGLAVRASR